MTVEAQQLNQAFYYTVAVKLSALVSLAALLAMLIIQFNYFDHEGSTYLELIHGFQLTHDRLFMVMTLAALCLFVITGVTAWIITLYASFKFAGPIYRLTRNIDEFIADRFSTLTPIRRNDCLQYESNILSKGVSKLQIHDSEIEKTLLEMKAVIQSRDSHPAKLDRLRPLVIRLKMLDEKVRL